MENENQRYIDALYLKSEFPIVKGNIIMNYLKFHSFEKIVSLMGETIGNMIYYTAYRIYTKEEIDEIRNNFNAKNFIKRGDYANEYNYMVEPDEKLVLPSMFGEDIFEKVQKKIDQTIAEKKNLKKNGELKKQQELEEKKRKN